MIPKRIRQYRLEKKLGAGGMGEVRLAHDESLDRQVAIKFIQTPESAGSKAKERFRREARLAARLKHQNIVQIYHIEPLDDYECIVMELVEGETLTEILHDEPLALDRALKIFLKIAEGLAYAHSRGVIHRDLKTDNVMITDTEKVKILDFGLAKHLDGPESSLSEPGRLMGTAHTMSPEQANCQPADQRSDLFSLGVLFYHCLTGISPFRAETFQDSLVRVIRHHPPTVRTLRPNVMPELSDLVSQLLEKKSENRPRSADEVVERLREISGTTIGAHSPRGSTTTPATLSPPQSFPTVFERPAAKESITTMPADPHSGNLSGPTTLPLDGGKQSIPDQRKAHVQGRWLLLALFSVVFISWLFDFAADQILSGYQQIQTWDQRPSPPLPSVAILEFENTSGRWLGVALAEMFDSYLSCDQGIRAVGPKEIASEGTQSLGPDHMITQEMRVGLRRSLGTRFLLRGSYTPKRLIKEDTNTAELHLALVDLVNGDILSFEKRIILTPGDLSSAIAPAAQVLRKKFSLPNLSEEKTAEIKSVFPTAEAVAPYFEGRLLLQDENSASLSPLRKAHTIDPNHPYILISLAEAEKISGYDTSVETAQEAIVYASSLPHEDQRNIEARAFIVQEELAAALSIYQGLVDEHPGEPRYHLKKARLSYHVDRYQVSLEAADQVLRLESTAHQKAEALFIKAQALLKTDPAQALFVFDELLSRLDDLRAGATEILHQAAFGLAVRGDLETSQKLLTKLIAAYTRQGNAISAARAMSDLGYVLQQQGKFGEAENLYEQALDTASLGAGARAQLLINLGSVLQLQGDLKEAIVKYREAGKLGGGSDRLQAVRLSNLGEIYYALGKLSDSKAYHEQALEINARKGDLAGQIYDRYRLGLVEAASGNVDKAADHFNHAVTKEKDDPILAAHSKLSLVKMALEVKPKSATEIARTQELTASAMEFFDSQHIDGWAAVARAIQARNLLPDISKAHPSCESALEQSNHQDTQVRFEIQLHTSFVLATTSEYGKVIDELERTADDFAEKEFIGHELEIRLAQIEIQMENGDTKAACDRLGEAKSRQEALGPELGSIAKRISDIAEKCSP